MFRNNKFYQKILQSESKKTALFFSAASILKTVGSMVAGIIVIRWVEPEKIGLWQSLMIAAPYVSFLQFGIMNGLNRELPFLMGAGKEEEGKTLAAAAQAYAIFIALLVFIFGLVTILIHWLAKGLNFETLLSILGVTLIISLTFYHNYLSVTFRAERAFLNLAKVYLVHFFVIISSVLFVYYKNYVGLIIYYVTCEFVLTMLMHSVRPVRIKPAKNLSALIKLIKTGLPIFGLGYMQQVSKSFTRIFLLYAGGTVSVGLFAPATAIKTAMEMLPKIMAQYLYPKMSYTYGRTNDKRKLWNVAKKITFSFLIFSSIMAIPAWFIVPKLIINYFPKYVEGIFAAQLILLSAIFTGSLISVNSLYSVKAFKQMLMLTIVNLVIYFIFPIIFIQFLKPLEGVALGYLVATTISFFFSLWVMFNELYVKSNSITSD